MNKNQTALSLLCVALIFAVAVIGELIITRHNARSYAQSKTPETPQLIVLEDKKRGATCYKLDWSDELSCIPSQWLYTDAMYEGEGK